VSRRAARGAAVIRRSAALGMAAVLCLPSRAATAQVAAQRGALVSVSVAPETVTVGEPFTVRIRVRAPKFATIHFPAVPDTADAIEAVDPRAMEDAGDAELIDRTAIYRLVAWDVGRHTPRFANVFVGTGGADQQYAVALPPVTVRSLLPADSAQRVPKDARDPVAPPGALWQLLLLAALLVAGIAWFWRHRRRRRAAAAPREPEPFSAATASFEALYALGLPAAGESGRHVIASVDVLRGYLARRFPDMRESLTAQEIERAMADSDVPVLPQRLTALLARESSVRFARAGITASEALALGKESRAIVRDIQTAYEARIRAMERRPQRGRRR
jgi:hypothetical protein